VRSGCGGWFWQEIEHDAAAGRLDGRGTDAHEEIPHDTAECVARQRREREDWREFEVHTGRGSLLRLECASLRECPAEAQASLCALRVLRVALARAPRSFLQIRVQSATRSVNSAYIIGRPVVTQTSRGMRELKRGARRAKRTPGAA
jgi:hypothetical protein